jgi:hypothetical protein
MIEKLEIRKADNGYILKASDSSLTVVMEETPQAEMIELLKQVAEYFGVGYNKFSSGNLNIDFTRKGHKVD